MKKYELNKLFDIISILLAFLLESPKHLYLCMSFSNSVYNYLDRE